LTCQCSKLRFHKTPDTIGHAKRLLLRPPVNLNCAHCSVRTYMCVCKVLPPLSIINGLGASVSAVIAQSASFLPARSCVAALVRRFFVLASWFARRDQSMAAPGDTRCRMDGRTDDRARCALRTAISDTLDGLMHFARLSHSSKWHYSVETRRPKWRAFNARRSKSRRFFSLARSGATPALIKMH
jgi:hypothetical protein